MEDIKIRKFLNTALERAQIGRVQIEKAGDTVRIILDTGHPGAVIGKKGQEIETLKQQLSRLIGKSNIEISVQEVRTPELNATLIAKSIADQLVRRVSFKQAMRKAAVSAMKAGAQGVKICCSGRLNGAEIARREWTRVGRTPLHTLRADIDYGFAEAKTTYGIIGVQVWICKGEFKRA
jgi:small subunit ribosomal protein S3